MSRLRSQTLRGLPLRTKMACVSTSRQLTKLPAVFNLRKNLPGDLLVAIEEMKEFFADFVDELGTDFRVAQLVFGLRLEDRILQTNGDRADHRFAHVIAVVTALGILVHRL